MVCMPNTSPSIDNAGTVALIQDRAQSGGPRRNRGALTRSIAGEELAPIGSLQRPVCGCPHGMTDIASRTTS